MIWYQITIFLLAVLGLYICGRIENKQQLLRDKAFKKKNDDLMKEIKNGLRDKNH